MTRAAASYFVWPLARRMGAPRWHATFLVLSVEMYVQLPPLPAQFRPPTPI